MTLLTDVDISSAAFKRDPYPFYQRLREEAPVFRIRLGKRQATLITRYDDVAAALRDSRLIKNRRTVGACGLVRLPAVLGIIEALERNMLDVDGADHARLRALVHRAFTPRRVEAVQAQIQATTDSLLDRLAMQGGPVDLIGGLALPLPITIISDILGIPIKDRRQFHHWTQQTLAVTNAQGGAVGMLRGLNGLYSLLRYVRGQIRRVRDEPGDDLLSALVQAEEAGDRLSEHELVAMVFILLIAGHETTVNLIGNGILSLLSYPEQLVRLSADPTLARSAVEELARYASPVETATERYAAEDMEIAGSVIVRGELVFAVLASANRDSAQFFLPDRLDLGRSPNKHLAFGLGAHYCVGAPLARLEAQTALTSLVTRFPDLRLASDPDTLRWRSLLVIRGLERLPAVLVR